MYKDKVIYDKPVYVGSTILYLSKLHMMKFHNEVVNTKETNEVSSWYGYWQDGLKKHLPGRAQVK